MNLAEKLVRASINYALDQVPECQVGPGCPNCDDRRREIVRAFRYGGAVIALSAGIGPLVDDVCQVSTQGELMSGDGVELASAWNDTVNAYAERIDTGEEVSPC